MADDKGIRKAVLKAVKKAGRPVRAREIIATVKAAVPGVDVLDKSVRAYLTMAADDGVIYRQRLSNGHNVIFSARPFPENPTAKDKNGIKIDKIRHVGVTKVNESESDVTITIRLPSGMSISNAVLRVEKSLTLALS